VLIGNEIEKNSNFFTKGNDSQARSGDRKKKVDELGKVQY
jgi:hypothetical protein